MTEKRFTETISTGIVTDNKTGIKYLCEMRIDDDFLNLVNTIAEENEQLKQALKESYINEICENCRYGNYFLTDNFDGGFEGDFECTKKHFGNDHWKCDGLTECDDFELNLKGDVE